MYKIDDYVVYKKDVCKVKKIRPNKVTGEDCYVLSPVDDSSLTIEAPVDNRMGYLRDVMSPEEAKKIIEMIPKVEIIQDVEDKYLESTYKNLIYNGGYEELIRIIKTSYLRNQERLQKNKKTSEKDEKYFELAEKYLYNEIAVALNMNFEETKSYIIEQVVKLVEE